jgi:uncharacterized protein (DUF488 family)
MPEMLPALALTCPTTVWTIGHSTRTLADFLDALRSQRIQGLADVRALPGSRRYPHFNGEALAPALDRKGISYEHFPDLGGRRKPRSDSRNFAWRNAAFRGYADHMGTPEFARAMCRLTTLARGQRTVIMCAESVWWRCHRSLIADLLKTWGWTVIHIVDAKKTQSHPFTSAARLVDGVLSYELPATQTHPRN